MKNDKFVTGSRYDHKRYYPAGKGTWVWPLTCSQAGLYFFLKGPDDTGAETYAFKKLRRMK